MATDSRKYFDAAQDRKNNLSKEFGAAHASDDKPYDLSAVVEAANNFLGGYDPQSLEDVRRLLYDAATNPGSLGASVMVTSHMPNVTPEEQKKKEDEAFWDRMQALQEQIRRANERISKMIDECREMAEWCRKQAEKAAEAMDKIATRMAKNSQFIDETDEIFESFKANGQFDREKARRLLQERGIKTDDKISDAKLIELMQKEWQRAIENNKELSERYDEQKKEKEKFESKQKELEDEARELKRRQDEINNSDLSLDEKQERLKELESQYTAKVQAMATELEDKEKQHGHDIENQAILEQSVTSKKDTEKLDIDKKEISSFMNEFATSASPAEKQEESKQGSLEKSSELPENKSRDRLAPA